MSAMSRPARVTVVEVGPRDGLQNEAVRLDVQTRIAFVNALAAAGLPVIEAAAFVSPRWVPQMADAAAVMTGITRRRGVRYPALVPNLQGLADALEAGVVEVAIFAAASETFSLRNINASIRESLGRYAEVARRAREAGVRMRAYLSTAFGCPYEGPVPVSQVVEVASRLRETGAYQIAISDTIGVAHPGQVWDVLAALTRHMDVSDLALHFHDTRGTALANVLAGLQAGVTTFDSSAGGLGGCPYAPGAAGNLATEDLVYMLDGLEIATGVSLDGVVAASKSIAGHLGHPLPSRYLQAVSARLASR
jgi:isopropylmalate/homocitrate/citramalate synthase